MAEVRLWINVHGAESCAGVSMLEMRHQQSHLWEPPPASSTGYVEDCKSALEDEYPVSALLDDLDEINVVCRNWLAQPFLSLILIWTSNRVVKLRVGEFHKFQKIHWGAEMIVNYYLCPHQDATEDLCEYDDPESNIHTLCSPARQRVPSTKHKRSDSTTVLDRGKVVTPRLTGGIGIFNICHLVLAYIIICGWTCR